MLDRLLKEIEAGLKSGTIKKRIIMHCLRGGNATIPDIAKGIDLSVPTITKYITEMCDDGYMCDYGKIETSEGRHPNIYGANANFCYFLGIDIKKFQLSLAIINFAGEIKEFISFDTFQFSNTAECFDEICGKAKHFIKSVSIDSSLIMNANVNIAGRVNTESGFSFTIFNFEERPLSDILTERLSINTMIENDTRAMTYGEYLITYKETPKNMIFINLSWGLGAGLILDGKVFCGKSGFAGEFGHTSVFENEIMCHCGKKGCLETEVSGAALHRQLIHRIKNGACSVLSKSVENNDEITMEMIVDAIEREDPLCIELIEEIGQKLGRNIANLINLLNPERIVIGGTLSRAGDYLIQPIKSAIKKFSLNIVSKDSAVSLSKLEPKAGVIGACLIARLRMFED